MTAGILAAVAAVMLSAGAAAQSSATGTQTQTPSGTTTQTPGTTQTQTPPSATTTSSANSVTLEGCLVAEKDVPGRQPNIVEKTGIMEDYILVDSKTVKGSEPTGTSGATATGTSGSTARYHVKGLSDDRLKPMLGRRVQVEGRLEDLDKPAPGSTDLPDIQATTIRQVAGECPAAK